MDLTERNTGELQTPVPAVAASTLTTGTGKNRRRIKKDERPPWMEKPSIFMTILKAAVLIFIVVVMLFPFLNVLSVSLSNYDAIRGSGLILFPKDPTLDAYKMLFSGGIVPSYIMWTNYFHIKNTIWALIVPNYLVSAFNVILVKNFYANNIPGSLIEAAQLDGATEMQIFRKLVFPMARPVVATISLFTGLCYWNDWTNGLYYVDNQKLYSIQLLLMKIMNNIEALKANANLMGAGAISLPGTSVRMAIAFIGILPILIVYPFVQKYLVEGVVIGAVKG